MSLNVKFSATDVNFTDTVSKIKREIDDMDDEVKKTSNGVQASFGSMAKAGAALAVGFGAIKVAGAAISGTFDFFADSVKNASDLGETISKVGVIFGEAKGSIESWANTSAKSLGQSKTQAMDAAAQFAFFGKAAGLGGEDLVNFSKELVELSADLASFNNATPEEAILAIGSALRGEAEPMRRFGVLLDDASLKNEALKMGLIQTTNDALTPQQKVLAAHALIMAQTTTAQGDFARTSGGLANQQRTLTANLKDFSTEMGQVLLPVVEVFIKEFNDRVIPIMRSFAKVIGEVDMKAFAEGVVDAITGASNAMGGFNDAISAFNIGKFGLGLKIAFASIKLQAADSLNSIYANAMAAIQASATFLMATFGPGSGIYTIISAQFDILGAKFQIAMIEGVKAIATVLTGMFDTPLINAGRKINPFFDAVLNQIESISTGFDGAIGNIEKGISNSENKISNAVGQIAGDFKLGVQEASKAFDSALSSSKQLIDTTAMTLELKKHQAELDKLEAEARAAAAKSAAEKLTIEEESVKIGKERLTHEQRIKELDADIASAKRRGNVEEVAHLEASKAYHLELESSKKKGMNINDALINAQKASTVVMEDHIKKAKEKLKTEEGITEEIKKQLGLGAKIIADANAAERKDRLDPGGRLEKQAAEATSKGNFAEARRIGRQLENREENRAFRDVFGKGNVKDLAKEAGIDTFRKTDEQLKQELIKKRQEEMKPKKEAEEAKRKKDKEKQAADKPENILQKSVDAIQKAVESLEKKLPMPALGV
jgi:hypothetical protein